MTMKKALGYLFAVTAIALFAACNGRGGNGRIEKEKMAVEIATVNRGPATRTVELFGRVSGASEAQVYSEFPGKLIRYTVKEGAGVSKGQTIALIDRSVPGIEYQPYPVRSPVSGVLAFAYLKDGSMVGSQTPLALVSGPGRVELSLDVPASTLPSLMPGADVFVLLPADTLAGRVVSVSVAVNPMSGAGTAKVQLDNSRGLLVSGAVVRCRAVVEKHDDVLTVPSQSIVDRDGKTVVYLLKSGTVHEVPVSPGIKGEEMVEVSGSLSRGDTVVTSGAFGLADGAQVEVIEK